MTPPALKRIDPASVPGLFREFGLTPVQHSYGLVGLRVGRKCCCVLTIMAAKRIGMKRLLKAVAGRSLGKAAGLAPDYTIGLMKGWDNCDDPTSEGDPRGFADGRAAWQAVVEAGLVSEATS